MVVQLARRHENASFEGPDRLVVRADGSVEAATELGHVLAERPHPVIELAAELADLARILGGGLLLPDRRDRPQQRDQVRRRRDDDVRLPRGFVDRRVVLVGGAEERLVRDEHDDEVRRGLELGPVALGGEPVHVVAHLACVIGEPRVAFAVVCLQPGEVRVERRLDDDVRSQQSSVRIGGGRLLDEVAVGDHAGVLDHALQLNLAPASADMRRPQCTRERRGRGAQPFLIGRERAQLLRERSVSLAS